MSTLPDIKTQFLSVIDTIIPDVDVFWGQRESGYRSDSNVRLRVQSMISRARPERRYTDAPPDDITERVYVPRTMVVQVLAETNDQDLEDSAWALAETIQTGLGRTDVLDTLTGYGIGIAGFGGMVQADYTDSLNDVRSAVAFEVRLNIATSQTNPTDVPYVKSVEYEGDVDGTIISGTVTDGT